MENCGHNDWEHEGTAGSHDGDEMWYSWYKCNVCGLMAEVDYRTKNEEGKPTASFFNKEED